MHWKNLSFWLKGGIILFLVNAGLIVLSFIFSFQIFSFGDTFSLTLGDLFYIFPFLMYEAFKEINFLSFGIERPLQYLIIILYSSLGYFLLGALGGWLYGKYKNKYKKHKK